MKRGADVVVAKGASTVRWALHSRFRTLSLALLASMLLLLLGCDQQSATKPVPERNILASMRVAAEKADVHSAPSRTSPVVSSYPAGEQVSVYSRREGWSEVSYGGEGYGWIRSDQLQSATEAVSAAPEESSAGGIAKPSVRFLRPPDPVSNSHATGAITLEASVSSEGRVFQIRTVENTTGSAELERQNRDQLQQALFAPVIVAGRATPFIYDYRVQY